MDMWLIGKQRLSMCANTHASNVLFQSITVQ